MLLNKAVRYLVDANYRLTVNVDKGLYRYTSDRRFLELKFKSRFGYAPDLDNPLTFNEKLQWLKLNDRKPQYTTMVDKYEAKFFVASIIGEEYIIPTLGVWNRFEAINFNSLPDQFVLKCTHDSGGIIICKDKHSFDTEKARKRINKSLKRNYFYVGREWPYKDVKPRIIAEPYLKDNSNESHNSLFSQDVPLKDYKIYTFGGKAEMCMINQERGIHTRADYFDRDFNWLDFKWGYDHADTLPNKPRNYELMFSLAEKLAVGTSELRIDFYEVDDKVYFGELTFFDGSGFDKIEPVEWDYKLGAMVKIPDK